MMFWASNLYESTLNIYNFVDHNIVQWYSTFYDYSTLKKQHKLAACIIKFKMLST